jgi:hypothetical protein
MKMGLTLQTEDETKIGYYYIKWDKLHIKIKNTNDDKEDYITVEPTFKARDADYKFPDDIDEDEDDSNDSDSEDDEDEESVIEKEFGVCRDDIRNYWKDDDGKTIILLKGYCKECGEYIEYINGTEKICGGCEKARKD